MNYIDYLSSPDDLETPVIICNSSGLVVYKNSSAMKNVRLPRRNTHIQFHLDRGGISEYERIPSRKKPSVISVDTGDRRANALVMPYKRGNEACSIWVFFALVQVNALSRIFSDIERDICDVGYEICDIVRCIDEKTFTLDERVRIEADKRIERRMEKILEFMFTGGDMRRVSASSFENTVSLLSEVTEKSFVQIGYDVRFTENSEKIFKTLPNTLDLRGFIVLYLYMASFAAKLSRDRRVDMTLKREKDCMFLKTEFSLGYPPFTVKGSKNILELAPFAPRAYLDLLIISHVCESYGYECECSVTEEDHGNVVIDVRIPAYAPNMVRASSDNMTENMLLARDLQAAIYYMFLDCQED